MKKIYLIAMVIALAAGLATYFFANELKTSKIVTGVNEATVVIALEDIDENTILTADMFQTVKLPQTAVSFGTVADVNDVIGYMTSVKILRGEQLMTGKLVPVGTDKAKDRLSYELADGKYAYSISVTVENAVSYFIKENDKVNIYDRATPDKPLLENVRVLKISDYPSNIQQDSGIEITSFAVLTLELDKKQISKLIPVEGNDRFKAVLVSYVDAYELNDDIAAADVPEDQPEEPQTNLGMGEITTAPPEAQQ
ncbi:MAG: Flp pilus assembly protein CpaB [Clostridia bacterium]|nr:Flp pilus assembly protein CpaB [Clostridia bacterium]